MSLEKYQRLFEACASNPLYSEMDEIIRIVHEDFPQSAEDNDGWVRVEDEEAPEHEMLLVKFGDDIILTGIYNEQKEWAIYYKDGCKSEDVDKPVTHWHKLPSLPKH